MIALMRKDLQPLFDKVNSAHTGLLMQKGLKVWESDEEKKQLRAKKESEDKRTAKEKLIDVMASVQANELYQLAFERWLNYTFGKEDFRHLSATVNGRLFTGLALGGAIETGAMVHHTYGMPMIAGSSIKGAVRTYAEYVLAKRITTNDDKQEFDYRIEIKKDKKTGEEIKIKHLQFDVDNQQILDVLFGKDDNTDAGYLIWHDAWWIPNVKNQQKPFVGEIVTVHHQQYYQGKLNEALDIESPIPNQQIAITGSFYFTIQGDKAWAEYALELLKGALQYQGLGAKGSNGYGYFDNIDGLEDELNKCYLVNKPVDKNDPLAKIKKAISLLSDEKLQESLSKGINKFFENLGLNKENDDDCKKVLQVLSDERADFIDGLKNDSGKNAQKILKFIEKYCD